MISFTMFEMDLLMDALERAASRYESMARASMNYEKAANHDYKAEQMRELRGKIQKTRTGVAA